jgi:F0F1-type ATP synthase membrane subunit b/b'
MAAMIVDAASKIIGESIDGRAHERLIEESLQKVSAG